MRDADLPKLGQNATHSAIEEIIIVWFGCKLRHYYTIMEILVFASGQIIICLPRAFLPAPIWRDHFLHYYVTKDRWKQKHVSVSNFSSKVLLVCASVPSVANVNGNGNVFPFQSFIEMETEIRFRFQLSLFVYDKFTLNLWCM
jgi:hypothetical protein